MGKSFGVTSTGGYGVLQELSENAKADKAEARDATGKVTDEKAYSVTKTASAVGVFDGDTPAEAGTSLTIGGLTGLITDVGTQEKNTDYKRINVAIEKKDSSTQVAYS